MPREKKDEVIRQHVREDLMLTDPQEARIVKILAEYLKGHKDRKRSKVEVDEAEWHTEATIKPPTRKQRVEMMRHTFAKEDPSPDRTSVVGPADKLREHILAVSLFPNIFNKKFLDREMP